VSGRHARAQALWRKNFGGAFLSAAAVGATVISLTAATPAHSSSPTTPLLTQAVALRAPYPPQAGGSAQLIPALGKGIAAALKAKAQWVPTANDVLKLAVSQVGVTEDASGGGTKFQKWFVSSPWAKRGVARDGGSVDDYADANWCDMFVSWVGNQLGVRGMGADAFTPTHARWFAQQGHWGETPKPGAVVFFSWNGGKSIDDIEHVGLVIKDNHDGTIQTVEGNTDNSVRIRTRDTSSVVGYGYPEYAPSSA
jgi:hypothetical protein